MFCYLQKETVKKKKSRLVLKQSLSVTFPPPLSIASAAAICHRLSGNRAASTLFHLSVAKLLLFSGGQRTQFAPSIRAGRGWGAGIGAGPWVHSSRKGPLQGEVPTSIIGSRLARAGVTWNTQPYSISRARASLMRTRRAANRGELGSAGPVPRPRAGKRETRSWSEGGGGGAGWAAAA